MTGEQYAHICGCQYSQQEKKEGMKSWILLDSDSTRDILGYSKYQTNTKTVPTTLKIMNNGGLLRKINKIFLELWQYMVSYQSHNQHNKSEQRKK